MVVGIIGAMEMEVNGLKERMSAVEVQTISGISFYQGMLCGVRCVVARCGVGKVHAALCTQTMLVHFGVSVVINTGVAGGIGKGVSVGDAVISSGLVQHDFDVSDLGEEKGRISGLDRVVIPATPWLVALAEEKAAQTYDGGVHVGVIATGDQFIGSPEKLHAIREFFEADACEMEGGAVAQVCFLNDADFVVIRAISDHADEQAELSFEQFAPLAAEKSTALLLELLPALRERCAE